MRARIHFEVHLIQQDRISVLVSYKSKMTVDLSHHINAKSKARHPSPLKDIIKFMGEDGMISLAGGEWL